MQLNNKNFNNKNPFKRLLIIIETIAFITTIISCAFMNFTLKDKNRYDSEYVDKYSYYYDCGFDLLVSGASNEQLTGFDNNSNVTHMSKAAKLSLNVKTDNNEDYRNIVIFDSYSDFEFSEFSSKRIVKECKTDDKSVAIDYKFSQLYNVNIGDKIIITANGKNNAVTISKIYRTDYLYTDGIIIATKDILDVNSKSYFAYLSSSNVNELKNELKTYKPMGNILPQTPYQTDEEYQKYLDEFYSKDYFSTCIMDISSQGKQTLELYDDNIKTANKRFILSIVVSSLLCATVSFGCFFINAKNKKDKLYKYIRDHGNKKIISLFSIFNLSFIAMVIICSLITFKISLSNLSVFYSFGALFRHTYLALLCPVILIFLNYIFTMISIKKA